MQFIKEEFTTTLEIKKSKFITHLCPYDQFDSMMKRLKEEHPKGRHFVYAYRYLNEHDQIVENSSDDGEPKGTSGKPTLNVLAGKGMVNTAVIIVRYFGGIRLGTGGLVKAYSDAVNLVLDDCDIQDYVKLEYKTLVLDYSKLSQVEYKINMFDINVDNKEFNTDVTLTLSGSKCELEKLSKVLDRDCILK